MCLVTRPEKTTTRRTIREEEPYYAPPRPVSNYHGGQAQNPRTSATYVRRTVSTVPVERASYERSYRASQPRLSSSAPRRGSGERERGEREREREYYSRTSRTYVR